MSGMGRKVSEGFSSRFCLFGRGSAAGAGGGGTGFASASLPEPPWFGETGSALVTSSGSSPSSSESAGRSSCGSAATSPSTRPRRGPPAPIEKPWKCGFPLYPVSKRDMHMYGSFSDAGSNEGITTRMESSVRRATMYVARSGAARTKSKRTSLALPSKDRTASRPRAARTFKR